MSDTPSELANAVPDDKEPGAEEVLASIRKIIVEDRTEADAGTASEDAPGPAVLVLENEVGSDLIGTVADGDVPVETAPVGDNAANTVPESDDDILDLVNFIDGQSGQIADAGEPAVEPDLTLDESLDLVIKTENANQNAPSPGEVTEFTPQDITTGPGFQEMPVAGDRREQAEPKATLVDPGEDISGAPQEIPEVELTVENEVLNSESPVPEELVSEETVDTAEEPKPLAVEDDMDLVKSLLNDLIEEPGEEGAQSVSGAGADSVFDEIPEDTGEDEARAAMADISGHGQDSEQVQTAKTAGENATADLSAEKMGSGEDVVIRPKPGRGGKLPLTTGAGAAAATTPQAALAQTEETEETEDHTAVEAPAGPAPGPGETVEESKTMVEAATLETRVSDDTKKDSSDAVVTVATVVEEKTGPEGSGPPIGHLVQEALKPVLQEWLDVNLETIVEQAVEKEVRRMSSGK